MYQPTKCESVVLYRTRLSMDGAAAIKLEPIRSEWLSVCNITVVDERVISPGATVSTI